MFIYKYNFNKRIFLVDKNEMNLSIIYIHIRVNEALYEVWT